MMKRIFKKVFVVALAAITACSVVACKDNGNSSGNGDTPSLTDTRVWAATASEKFLRDTDYSSRYSDTVFEVKAFRNEEEAGQVIITAAEDTAYTFETADLTSESGAVLDKSAFTVYNEKYIYLDTIKDSLNSQGAGYYPDALLPYEKAVEYNENQVKKGCNQGVYIVVKPSKEQAAGVYTGNFKLTLNGAEKQIPAKVTVYDYTLTDQTHMKTSFSFPRKDIGVSELDTSAEMAYAYADFFTSKRLTTGVPLTDDWSFDRQRFFDYVSEKIDEPHVAVIGAPFTGGATMVRVTYVDGVQTLAIGDAISDDNEIVSVPTVAWDSVQPFYEEYFVQSLKRGKDMYQKMFMYLSLIDEYDSGANATFGLLKATYNLRRMEDLFARLADLIATFNYHDGKAECNYEIKFDTKNDNGGYGYYLSELTKPKEYDCVISEEDFAEFKESLISSVKKVTCVATATKIDDFIYENQNFASFCPTIADIMPVINVHKSYAQKSGREVWTYTAVNPQAPYPTYHLDDALLSSRMLGTIMYENDIVGNLFWATGLSRICDGNDAQLSGQDYYQEPLRFTGANGDGFLLYPGRPYGIYGPVSSMRMESIKDSVEDYDLLYELENYYYKKHGATAEGFDSILKFATESLYGGSRLNYEEGYIKNFLSSRDLIASLLAAAANNDTVITDYAFTDGKARFTVSAPEDAEISSDGEKLTGVKNGDFVVYEVAVSLDKAANFLRLSSVRAGKTYDITLALGGKTQGIGNEELKSMLSVSKDNAEITLTSDGVKVAFATNADRKIARVRLAADSLKADSGYESVTVNIYNGGDKRVRLSVTGRSKTATAGMNVDYGELAEGWNEITLSLSAFGVKGEDILDYLNFAFTPITGDITGKIDLYFKDLTMKGA